jgi:hypothetical protein
VGHQGREGVDVEGEIINPSDKAFLNVDDWEAACLAVCVVGSGKYGIEVVPHHGMPIFLFGGEKEADGFFTKEFGHTFKEAFKHVSHGRLIKALESFRLEGERTSMNNFVGRAHSLAKKLEKERIEAVKE